MGNRTPAVGAAPLRRGPRPRDSRTRRQSSAAEEVRDKRWIALALLALAQFVVVHAASIVNVALPSIGRELQFSQENLTGVVNAYALTFGGFLLLGGRMADLLGRRRLFVVGLMLFAVASLAGGLASDDGQLIAARAVQGLGAALLSPAALSLLTVIFKEGRERNMAMGVCGAVAGSAGAAGVLLGGMLTEWPAGSGCSSTCRSASSPRRSRCACCPKAASPPPVTSASPAP